MYLHICIFPQKRCELGWTGSSCDVCITQPRCIHGKCNGKAYGCDCDDGWRGLNCEIPICADGCNLEHATCVKVITYLCTYLIKINSLNWKPWHSGQRVSKNRAKLS